MIPINYIEGDATEPVKLPAIIAHVCNDIGKWGAGFVLALLKKWKEPEERYKRMYRNKIAFKLGKIQLVDIKVNELIVCNMIAQHGIGGVAIKYGALDYCLNMLAFSVNHELTSKFSVHMPRIGCGLAGGTWDKVEPLIIDNLCKNNIEVFVYDLK